MSTIVKFTESSALQNFSLQCKQNALDVTSEEGEWFTKVVLSGVTDFLNITKTTARPVAVQICDLKGNHVASAVVEYIPAEDDTETAAGSWNYYWTFDKENVAEDAQVYQITSSQVIEVLNRTAYDLIRASFKSPTFISQMTVYLFSVIKDTLDQNAPAAEGDDWVLDMDGYFEASVAIEDGKKVFAFAPKGELKVKIKDDTVSEK